MTGATVVGVVAIVVVVADDDCKEAPNLNLSFRPEGAVGAVTPLLIGVSALLVELAG